MLKIDFWIQGHQLSEFMGIELLSSVINLRSLPGNLNNVIIILLYKFTVCVLSLFWATRLLNLLLSFDIIIYSEDLSRCLFHVIHQARHSIGSCNLEFYLPSTLGNFLLFLCYFLLLPTFPVLSETHNQVSSSRLALLGWFLMYFLISLHSSLLMIVSYIYIPVFIFQIWMPYEIFICFIYFGSFNLLIFWNFWWFLVSVYIFGR
jgi:hypothetical protein